MSNEPDRPRVEQPRHEPEIIPPGAQPRGRGASFDSIFIRVEEGEDGVRRVSLKRPGPFTIILVLLAAGLIAALVFVLLAGLVLLWIPLAVAGLLLALFSGTARAYWRRLRGLLGGDG